MTPPAQPPAFAVSAPERVSWRAECRRAALVVALSAALGLSVNLISPRPVPLLASDGPGALPERAERIGAAELQALMRAQQAVILLDVRREEPFRAAHAPGSIHAPADNFPERYQDLNLGNKLLAAEFVVLLCESDDCPSADRVAKFLRELHHNNVRVFHRGWSAYEQAGFPVEGETAAPRGGSR